MVGIHQSSGSSPPNRPKVSKRDRERLSRLDRKIHKLKECMKFAKNCNLPFSRYETSIFKFEKDPHTLNGPFYYRHFEYKGERYKNNDWVCLHKKHINLLKNSEKDVSCFKNNCSGEHFVSSILNSYNVLDEIFKAELLLECWDGYSNNFPSAFNANDKEKIYSLKSNNPHAFFLRKFKTSISDDYIKNILS